MSAAARAEARRKAILNRGTDRLAKLTTSARGADALAYQHDDPPLPNLDSGLRKFVGEETSMSPSRQSSHSPAPPSYEASAGPPPDPSVWSQQQQQQFLQALMGGGTPPSLPGMPTLERAESRPPTEDPLQAMMAQFSKNSEGLNTGGPIPSPPSPPSRLQKFMPLIHLLAFWCLLGYFVFWKEPVVFQERSYDTSHTETKWQRWAELAWKSAQDGQWGVQVVPFFWAFTTLQIILHSLRIFSGFDKIEPPMLLSLALPHIPPPLPSVILNGLKYFQMGSVFLDDVAGLVFALGFLVFVAGWFAS